jgi:hypothetical protein
MVTGITTAINIRASCTLSLKWTIPDENMVATNVPGRKMMVRIDSVFMALESERASLESVIDTTLSRCAINAYS